MKNNCPKDQNDDARDMLRLAERNLARVLRELDATIAALEAREDGADRRAKGVTADVRKAIQTVFDERQRIEKLDEKNPEGRARGGLDLDAARAEVRRRLARLRQRSETSEISQKPE